MRVDIPTFVYLWVVDSFACPSISWIALKSTPASRRWVAKECLSACGVGSFEMPLSRTYLLTSLWTVLGVSLAPPFPVKSAPADAPLTNKYASIEAFALDPI